MNKSASINLLSHQKTDSGIEEIKISSKGVYSLINGRHFVKYDEETEDGQKNKVLLKFEDDFFEMTKSGEVSSTLHFEEGLKTEGLYKTPYGAFLIETDTQKLDIDIKENGICIQITYELAIDGEYVADCNIDIEIEFIRNYS